MSVIDDIKAQVAEDRRMRFPSGGYSLATVGDVVYMLALIDRAAAMMRETKEWRTLNQEESDWLRDVEGDEE